MPFVDHAEESEPRMRQRALQLMIDAGIAGAREVFALHAAGQAVHVVVQRLLGTKQAASRREYQVRQLEHRVLALLHLARRFGAGRESVGAVIDDARGFEPLQQRQGRGRAQPDDRRAELVRAHQPVEQSLQVGDLAVGETGLWLRACAAGTRARSARAR